MKRAFKHVIFLIIIMLKCEFHTTKNKLLSYEIREI